MPVFAYKKIFTRCFIETSDEMSSKNALPQNNDDGWF